MRPLDITTQQTFESFCEKEFPGKIHRWTADYCFVQAGTHLKENLHYEFLNSHVHLHIEGSEWRGIRNYLAEKAPFAKVESRIGIELIVTGCSNKKYILKKKCMKHSVK